MDRTIRFWNKASKNFDTIVYDNNRESYRELISLSKKYLHNNDIVLDFGCGTGIIENELSWLVNRILAIDISDAMIDKARSKSSEKEIQNVEYRITNIFDSGLKPGSFNVVLAFNILHFFKDENEILARINQLLTPGGMLISTTGCFSEKFSLKVILVKMLSRLKLHPYLRSLTCVELENSIKRNQFEILETKVLIKKPVNYFIAGKKVN